MRVKKHTWELQSKALLAGEEVSCKLQTDRVKGAMKIWRKCGAAQLPEQHAPIRRTIPDPQNIMHFFGMEDQEMQPVELQNITSNSRIYDIEWKKTL